MKIQFIDCEMLCFENGGAPQGQTNHIIQIGLVEVNVEDLKISRSKSYLIRPKNKDFEVSDYCTDLTGITRSMLIDEGHYFPEVIKSIKKEYAPLLKLTYAWGSDYDPLAKHCTDYDCSNPWSTNGILDFGLIFRVAYNHKHKMPLIEALRTLDLQFYKKEHDALNDAMSLALLHNEMIRRLRNTNKVL